MHTNHDAGATGACVGTVVCRVVINVYGSQHTNITLNVWCIEYRKGPRSSERKWRGGTRYFSGARGGERRPRRARVVGASRARRGRLSPKGRGRVGLASRPPVGTSVDPFARASFPGAHTWWCAASQILGSFALYYAAARGGCRGCHGGALYLLQGVPWHLLQGCYWHPCRGCPGGAGVFLYTAPPCIPCNCTQPASRAFYALCTLPCVTGSPDNTHVTRAR